jgi:membrane protein YdbS with pleckstrin-like domain
LARAAPAANLPLEYIGDAAGGGKYHLPGALSKVSNPLYHSAAGNWGETPVSYLKHVLQPGETVRYQGSVHWIVYWPAIIFAILGAVAAAFGPAGWVVAAVLFAIALIFAGHAWFKRWTTEIAVTDRRVIWSRGFISRKSVEVHMDKIESVDVDQSVLGRLLDYGTVTINGTGTTMETLPLVERPFAFRNAVTAT